MNENAFFDELLLMYLYKKRKVKTSVIEKFFGDIDDFQNVNNIVSNRRNKTSYLNPDIGYITYNEKERELEITILGKRYIEGKFPPNNRR